MFLRVMGAIASLFLAAAAHAATINATLSDPIIGNPGEVVTFTLDYEPFAPGTSWDYYSGSFSVSFGDGTNQFVTLSPNGGQLTLSHVFYDEGTYNISGTGSVTFFDQRYEQIGVRTITYSCGFLGLDTCVDYEPIYGTRTYAVGSASLNVSAVASIVSPIPLPAAGVTMLSGLAILVGFKRRRKSAA